MKTILLQRNSYRQDCTLGVMYDSEGDALFATLEEPDLDNTPNISCIPEGQYICVPYTSAKFKNVWEITNVPGRSKILIHAGNTTDDIEGCILVGRKFGKLKGKTAVISSQTALEGLRKHIGVSNSFQLRIERI